MMEFIPLIGMALAYVAIVLVRGYFQGLSPYAMEYHRSGLPSQVGLIHAVHFEKKRFKTMNESIAFAKGLTSQGYKVINVDVSRGTGGYRIELNQSRIEPPWQYHVTVFGNAGITLAQLTAALGA